MKFLKLVTLVLLIKKFLIYAFMGFSTVSIGIAFALPCGDFYSSLDQSTKYKLRDLIQKDKQSFISKYKGMKGYAQLAQKIDMGMQYLFQETPKHLSPQEKKKLGWQQFVGIAPDYNYLESLITDGKGNINPEFLKNYAGTDGQVKFAEEHFDGNMLKAFKNVSAVLGGVHIMRELKLAWKFLQETTDQHHSLIKLFEETSFEELQNLEGQQRVADLIFKGNMRITYRNVSSLKNRLLNETNDFKKLNWKK